LTKGLSSIAAGGGDSGAAIIELFKLLSLFDAADYEASLKRAAADALKGGEWAAGGKQFDPGRR
jgi:hypothetical protein